MPGTSRHLRGRSAVGTVVAVAVLIGGGAAPAQEPAPTFSISAIYDTARSHAPVQFDATLSWQSPDLLEGRLQLDFYVAERRVHTWISRDVLLSASDVTLPVMAPAVLIPTERDALQVDARFITSETVYRLDVHDVPYWVDWKRTLVIGVVHPDSAAMPPPDFVTPFRDRFAWIEPFRLDDSLPYAGLRRHLTCRSSQFDPERVPEEPLELCAFDLLIVTSEGLNDLEPEQLDALAAWVEGGGAVCVAGERARSEAHREFLNRIVGSSPIEPRLAFVEDGAVRPLLAGDPPWLLAAPGVGRSVVTFQPVDVRTAEWRRVALSLWRMRAEQVDNVLSEGRWTFPLPNDSEAALQSPFFHPLAPRTAAEPDAVEPVLMPQRIEGVPLRTVAVVLAACLLAIGPGDYLLLTWLNRRRWTWVLFPAVAIGFAAYTVRLAQSHMGKADHRTTLTIVDMTRDGRPARVSRFELLFSASQKNYAEDLERTLAAPLQQREERRLDSFGYPLAEPPQTRTRPGLRTPGAFIGRVPLDYSHVRNLRQWSPQITRYTSFAPLDERPIGRVDWTRIDAAACSDPDRRERLLRDLQSTLPDARIMLLHRNHSLSPSAASDDAEPPASADDARLDAVAELTAAMSRRSAEGLFHVVSQISPNAAGDFEDLTLLDRSDRRQWLLLIAVADDDGRYIIYRRLLREEDT